MSRIARDSPSAGLRLPALPDLPHPTSITNDVFAVLRAAIVGGEIPPGSRLLAHVVAANYGISRGPVREALRQLEAEGLVKTTPFHPIIVVGVPESELDGIFAVLSDIEARALAEAADSTPPGLLESLDLTVGQFSRSWQTTDVEGMLDADSRFHLAVLDAVNLVILRRVWSTLDGLIRLRIEGCARRLEPQGVVDLLGSNGEPLGRLLDSLRDHDEIEAAKRSRRHVEDLGRILATLESRRTAAAHGQRNVAPDESAPIRA